MKSIYFPLSALLFLLFSCTHKTNPEITTTTKVVTILAEQMPCLGNSAETCIQYYDGVEQNMPVQLRTNKIEGIDLVQGYEYVLRIEESKAPQSTEDEKKQAHWKVKEVISKKKDQFSGVEPEKVIAEFYENADLRFSIFKGRKDILEGENIVFRYQRIAEHRLNIADDEFTEELFFEIHPDMEEFSTDENPEMFSTLYGYYCFCPNPGLKPVMNGSIKGTKNEDGSYTVNFNFPEQKFEIGQNKFQDSNSDVPATVFYEQWVKTITFHKAEFNADYTSDMSDYKDLHRTWLITKVRNKSVSSFGLPKQPIIDLYPIDKQFSGNDGCNAMNGKISHLEANQITFDNILTTRMACPDAENVNIGTALKEVTHFEIKEDKLFLYNSTGSLIVELESIDLD